MRGLVMRTGWAGLIVLMLGVLSGARSLAGAAGTPLGMPPATPAPPAAGGAATQPAAHAAPPPATPPASQPGDGWGATVDDLSARLVVQPTYAVGQAIGLVIEVRNRGPKDRAITDALVEQGMAKLSVTGPDGPAQEIDFAIANPNRGFMSASQLVPAGGVVRSEVAELRMVVRAKFDKPGRYELAYTFAPKPVPPPPRGVVMPGLTGDAKPWVNKISTAPVAFTIRPLAGDELTVHEWGVFNVYPDAGYANQGMRAEWATMPDFFYRQFPTQRLKLDLTKVFGDVAKPVIYFYTPLEALRVKVNVSFTDGAPVVWWPASQKPVSVSTGDPLVVNKVPLFRALIWDAWLGAKVPNPLPLYRNLFFRGPDMMAEPVTAAEAELPAGLWLTDARLKTASLVSVDGTPPAPGNGGWPQPRVESERFIYYDGLVPAPDYLAQTTAADGAVTLQNTAAFGLPRVLLIDRRGGKDKPRLWGITDGPLAAGAQATVKYRPFNDPAPIQGAMRQELLAAGLFEAEADSLLKIWTPGFFEAPGLTALYVLPRAEYDRLLPISIDPAPGKLVRVGIVRHARLEGHGEINARIAQLIKQLDAEDFSDREMAARELVKIGPPALRPLQDLLPHSPSPEVTDRAKAILATLGGEDWLKDTRPRKPAEPPATRPPDPPPTVPPPVKNN